MAISESAGFEGLHAFGNVHLFMIQTVVETGVSAISVSDFPYCGWPLTLVICVMVNVPSAWRLHSKPFFFYRRLSWGIFVFTYFNGLEIQI